MSDRSITVRLIADIASYRAGLRQAAGATSDFGKAVTADTRHAHQALDMMGRGALLAGGSMVAGAALAVKAAVDWESAWAGVTKTVDGTEAQLASLQDGLREMATELPATHGEIAAVAEAAGALGISTPAVEAFTRSMIDLGETTDLTADQAATAFARIANIMGTPQTEFERMGSTVVDLGNKLAATESEITEMALRIAGAGRQVGLSESEVLGFAGALSSVGVEAEAGGSSISRVFVDIASAVRGGGENLAGFAETAGMTVAEFRTAFQTDAAGAIVSFIEGLGRMGATGEDVFGRLRELDLDELRVRDALLRAAGAGDLFAESLDIGTRAWEENTALAEEAAARYGTTAAQLEMMRNKAVDLAIDLGGTLVPALAGAARAGSDMITGFGELPGFVQTSASALGGLGAAGLTFAGTAAVLKPKVDALKASLNELGDGGKFLARNLGTMGAALGVAGVAIAGVSWVLGQQARQQADAQASVELYTQAILEQNGALADNVDLSTANQLAQSETGRLLREAGIDFALVAEQIRSGGSLFADAFSVPGSDMVSFEANLRALREDIEQGTVAMTPFIDELFRLADSGTLTGDEIRTVAREVGQLTTNYGDASVAAEAQAGLLADVGLEADGTRSQVFELNRELEEETQRLEDAKDALDSYVSAMRGAVDPLFGMIDAIRGNRDAQLSYQDALRAVAEAEQAAWAAEAEYGRGSAELEQAIRDHEQAIRDVDAAQRDAAESALDVNVAAAELRGAIEDGTVSLEDAVVMLDEWARQGLLTEGQAQNLAVQMAVAADEADRFQGERVATLRVSATGDLDVLRQVKLFGGYVDVNLAVNPHAGAKRAHGGYVDGPSGVDRVPIMATAGEYVIRKSAADALGPDLLAKMNQADLQGFALAAGEHGPELSLPVTGMVLV